MDILTVLLLVGGVLGLLGLALLAKPPSEKQEEPEPDGYINGIPVYGEIRQPIMEMVEYYKKKRNRFGITVDESGGFNNYYKCFIKDGKNDVKITVKIWNHYVDYVKVEGIQLSHAEQVYLCEVYKDIRNEVKDRLERIKKVRIKAVDRDERLRLTKLFS